MTLKAIEVFTPNEYPIHTYVDRTNQNFEERLRRALETPKAVVSISGPSKSGKTVLVKKLVEEDNLITVSGAEIEAAADLWERVLDWMGTPSSVTSKDEKSSTLNYGGKVAGELGIPMVAKGGGEASISGGNSNINGTTITNVRKGLSQVVKDIADSTFVLLVDDFHYMGREVQSEAAKQIKTAAERGVKICVASVPHRSDDVVRSNPELRGRTSNLDTNFWSTAELQEIGKLGFDKLNVDIPVNIVTRFAEEACGSPQLMQAICLQACYVLGIKEEQTVRLYPKADSAFIENVLEEASLQSNYSSLVTDMHQGPKTRGVERKEFDFTDGTRGDVYRAILLAIAQDPPAMTISYPNLLYRVKQVCNGETPVGRSITETCDQIVKFAVAKYPDQRIVEFDSEGGSDTFSIVDPYWMFYLRSSSKLDVLGKPIPQSDS